LKEPCELFRHQPDTLATGRAYLGHRPGIVKEKTQKINLLLSGRYCGGIYRPPGAPARPFYPPGEKAVPGGFQGHASQTAKVTRSDIPGRGAKRCPGRPMQPATLQPRSCLRNCRIITLDVSNATSYYRGKDDSILSQQGRRVYLERRGIPSTAS